MKKPYMSKHLLKFSFSFIVLFSVMTLINSCKKDDEDEFKEHLVQFEVKSSTGVIPKTVVRQVGTVQTTIYNTTQTPITFPWASDEFFVNSSQSQLNLAANADLPNGNSKLIVNIYIDGEVAKSDTVTGKGVKSAAVFHSFLEL